MRYRLSAYDGKHNSRAIRSGLINADVYHATLASHWFPPALILYPSFTAKSDDEHSRQPSQFLHSYWSDEC